MMLIPTACMISFPAGFLLTIASKEIIGLDAKNAYSASTPLRTAGNFFACRN